MRLLLILYFIFLFINSHAQSSVEIISSTNSSVCHGTTIDLFANLINCEPPYTLQWSHNNETTQSTQYNAVSAPNPTFTISVNVVGNTYSISDTFVITTLPKPIASIVGTNTIGCMPLHTQFSANGGPNATITNFTLDFGDGSVYNGGASSYSHTYNNEGTYNVNLQITNNFGCKDTTFVQNYIDVYPLPIAEFTYNINGNQVSFTNQSILGNTYIWDFGDPIFFDNSTLENPAYTYTNPGTYTVSLQVTSINGCVDTITHVINTITSINNLNVTQHNLIFPQPASEKIYLKLEGYNEQELLYNIYTFDSKKIIQYGYFQNSSKEEISLKNIEAGVYFIEIFDNTKIHSFNKLIVVKD